MAPSPRVLLGGAMGSYKYGLGENRVYRVCRVYRVYRVCRVYGVYRV